MTTLSSKFANHVNTGDATVVAGQVNVNKIAYVNGERILGSHSYDPAMMTYSGASWYEQTRSYSGNKFTIVVRFNLGTETSGVYFVLSMISGISRGRILCHPSDDVSVPRRGIIEAHTQNTSSVYLCRLFSNIRVDDNEDHVIFYSFDGDTGQATFYIDGVNADDTGYSGRVAPVTGTLPTNSSKSIFGSRSSVPDNPWPDGGQIGYAGYREEYLTNPTDFYHPINGLQEINETTWTEWGAQPIFWNKYGTMSDNKGSGGNMTENGTITGPA